MSPPHGAPEEVHVSKRRIRAYWDAHPISTDSVPSAPGSAESFENIYARWLRTTDAKRIEFLESCRAKRVLEVGCGIGKDARFLTENNIDYYGVDYSFQSVKLAMRQFDLCGLRKRFINADAAALPIADDSFDLVFSIGVLHHTPDIARACNELVRVTKPGGIIRVMLYNKASYHFALVNYVIVPLIWIMDKLPRLASFADILPKKFRTLLRIVRSSGFDRQRILAASADSAFAGEGNYCPHTSFHTEATMRQLFHGLEQFHFFRRNLKYFPFPFFRRSAEARWGFFLTMTARKPH